jgi:glycosyltransferase involved in cell wall biosynthesis
MPLRLGVIHWSFPPVTGGVETHLRTICPEMMRLGAKAIVLSGSVKGRPESEVIAGVTVLRWDSLNLSQLDKAREQGEDVHQASKAAFANFLDEHAIDVVQAHNLHYDYLELSRALEDACSARDVPFYLVIHNDLFVDRSEDTTQHILTDIAWDALVPISNYLRESLASTLPGIPDERWTVILHGIDTDTFSPVDDQNKERLKSEYGFKGRQVILHPGRFLPWKGILPAIRSMPSVIEQEPKALMVMTGRAQRLYRDRSELARYDAQIDAYIEGQDLGKHVHIGNYTHDDIPDLMALGQVVIYTTIGNEPFGLVPVEGMACGTPVIVTNSGGLVESVIDGETGFIISRDETELSDELADRIVELLANPELVRTLGEVGRERVEERFDKRRMANDYIELSRELLV